MPFNETPADYETKVRRFVKENPGATDDDIKALFPRMLDPSAIWARFNAGAVAHAKARTKGGSANAGA
jgi:hypothetical protein